MAACSSSAKLLKQVEVGDRSSSYSDMEDQRVDFGFAFNDPVFSNCVLRIEVIENSLDSKEDCIPDRKSEEKDLDKENENSLDSKGDCIPDRKSEGKDLDKENENYLNPKEDCIPKENEKSFDPKGECIPIRKSKGKYQGKGSGWLLLDFFLSFLWTFVDKVRMYLPVQCQENSLDPKADCIPNRKSEERDLDKENAKSLDSKGDCISDRKSEGKDLDKENANCLDSKGDCIPDRKSEGKDLDKKNVIEAKTLHINSLILAAKSPFFYKLFKNEMRESQQRDVTLKINASEDAALMEVLKFMYSDSLSSSSPDLLLGMLLVADRFGVTSCTRMCRLMLQSRHMSRESALSYLGLPATVAGNKVVQPLIDAAKEYIAARYLDFNKSRKEVKDLPLCAVEAVLGSDGLQVDSEDDVVDFVLEWARGHYPKLEERREILTKRLAPCICFSYMSNSKLKQVLDHPDFASKEVSKLVADALINANRNSLGRIYKLRPIKVVQFEFSQPRCVVYFDLKKEECAKLFESTPLNSQSFFLGGRWFCLSAQFSKKEQSFGLFLIMTEDSESCALDHEFAVIKNPLREFQVWARGDFKFFNSKTKVIRSWGYPNLFEITWMAFMNENSEYFVDGILHLRAYLTIKNAL